MQISIFFIAKYLKRNLQERFEMGVPWFLILLLA